MSVVASVLETGPAAMRRRARALASAFAAACLAAIMIAPSTALAIAPPISFTDANLKAAVVSQLGLPAGSDVYQTDLNALTTLDASSLSIASLGGLEFASNLTTLQLYNNSLTDITPLSTMTSLQTLNIASNQITSIAPLSGLTNLTSLDAGDNPITSITPLSGLTGLTNIGVAWCEISDISALSGLTNLQHLSIYHNTAISDLTPLTGLTQLRSLSAGQIAATNLTPLAGLTNLTSIDLGYVPITDISPLAGLTNLTTLNLFSTGTLTDISAISNLTKLQWLNISEAEIYDITPLANLNATSPSHVHLRWNWLDMTPGSQSAQVVAALRAKGYAVPDTTQRPGGAVIGNVTSPSGTPLSGVTISMTSGPRTYSSAGGAYTIGLAKPGERTITFSKPYYISKSATLTVTEGATSTANVTLTPARIALTITRSPSSSSLTYKRKRGVAKFTLSATLSDGRGKVRGQRVWLQKSSNGRSWTTVSKITTNSVGKASVTLKIKKRQTIYYRWYAPQTAYNFSKTTSKQRVRIK